MNNLRQSITAESIIEMAKNLGLTIEPFEDKYFSLEHRCACPAGIATIMWDPHSAHGSFGNDRAFKVLGPMITSGLVFGFDLRRAPHALVTEEFRRYAEIGAEVRVRMVENQQ